MWCTTKKIIFWIRGFIFWIKAVTVWIVLAESEVLEDVIRQSVVFELKERCTSSILLIEEDGVDGGNEMLGSLGDEINVGSLECDDGGEELENVDGDNKTIAGVVDRRKGSEDGAKEDNGDESLEDGGKIIDITVR